MFITIINDCKDDNARGRQTSRLAALTNVTPSFIGVDSDLEAGLHLIDVLDAAEGRPGLVLVNVAPRGGGARHWENGTPFAYFKYRATIVVSSVDGHTLSGVKKYGLIEKVELLDITTTTKALQASGMIAEEAAGYVPRSQFRSFDFTPRVGALLLQAGALPSTPYPLSDVPSLPPAIWHIDNFGNCKTTLTRSDIDDKREVKTRFGTFPLVERLRDVPDGAPALIEGSSGLPGHKFMELVIQRQSFAARFGASIGDDLFNSHSHLVRATG